MLKDEKELADYMSEKVCDVCGGHRLKRESLAVKVADTQIAQLLEMPIAKTYEFLPMTRILHILIHNQK